MQCVRGLNEVGFAIQLACMALLPLFNALLFDWDAGMVAGLLIVETLLVMLLMPLIWTGTDLAWHRFKQRQQQHPALQPSTEAAAAAAFPLLRRLASNLFLLLLVMAFGGLLPIILLSVSSPEWLDWVGNRAVTETDLPAPFTLFLWPFLLAWYGAEQWPSFAWSVLAVVIAVTIQAASTLWQGLRHDVHPSELEDEQTAQLALVSVPLFIMAGIAWAAGGWFAQHRMLPGALAGQDAAMWALVALIALRSVAGWLLRAGQRSERGRLETSDRWLGAAQSALLTVGLGLALLLALAFALSSPAPKPVAQTTQDCLTQWPGDFQPASRAQLDPQGELRQVDTQTLCERLAAATSLRLGAAIDPRDLEWFSSVNALQLSGTAAVHAADLHRLPALRRVAFSASDPVDARSLSLPPSLDLLSFSRTRLHHADALWQRRDIAQLALSQVELVDTQARRGRTAIRTLSLDSVSGELDQFLHGALGVERLRLRDTALSSLALSRLLWVRELNVGESMNQADYCRLIANLHRIRGQRARDCGHRFAVPD